MELEIDVDVWDGARLVQRDLAPLCLSSGERHVRLPDAHLRPGGRRVLNPKTTLHPKPYTLIQPDPAILVFSLLLV